MTTPPQNSAKPPPVPVDSMIGERNSGLERTKASETALAKGKTVEEPTARIESREAESPPLPPQAARAAAETAANMMDLVLVMGSPLG